MKVAAAPIPSTLSSIPVLKSENIKKHELSAQFNFTLKNSCQSVSSFKEKSFKNKYDSQGMIQH